MEVGFATPALRKSYENQVLAARAWGTNVGRKYIQRVNLLLAARDLSDLQVPRSLHLHPLHGIHEGKLAINLDERWRLIFTYDKEEGTVRIEEVTNHYGD
jgi:plasmid maintenance system killer protein